MLNLLMFFAAPIIDEMFWPVIIGLVGFIALMWGSRNPE